MRAVEVHRAKELEDVALLGRAVLDQVGIEEAREAIHFGAIGHRSVGERARHVAADQAVRLVDDGERELALAGERGVCRLSDGHAIVLSLQAHLGLRDALRRSLSTRALRRNVRGLSMPRRVASFDELLLPLWQRAEHVRWHAEERGVWLRDVSE